MAKWKELPTDTDKLRELLAKLKDKEMRLEADLAIKERPDLAEAITKLALAIADVKKIDANIAKGVKPIGQVAQDEILALVKRIEHLQRQLDVAKALLREKGGKDAEKFAELRGHRAQSFMQLEKIYKDVEAICQRNGIQLGLLLPSLTDYLVVEKPPVTELDQQVNDMVEPPELREHKKEVDRSLVEPLTVLDTDPDDTGVMPTDAELAEIAEPTPPPPPPEPVQPESVSPPPPEPQVPQEAPESPQEALTPSEQLAKMLG